MVERLSPLVDDGRFPAKAAVGDPVTVEADAFCDGHDLLACDLRVQREGATSWTSVEMTPIGNDRWRGSFVAAEVGRHRFAVRAGVDRYETWLRDVVAFADAGEDVSAELLVGGDLLARTAARARGADRAVLGAAARRLAEAAAQPTAASLASLETPDPAATADPAANEEPARTEEPRRTEGAAGRSLADEADAVVGAGTLGTMLRDRALRALVRRYAPNQDATTSADCVIVVEPERARFSTWYELFPRSASPDPSRPGTLADVVGRLDYLERLGIDVLYLPPIHPIGTTGRKGVDGSTVAGPEDPGSPWAIGSSDGGHTAVDPGLGTLDDVDALVDAAGARGISIALDLAFQCSPDHPWVREHPAWFRHRPDGTIRYAENPPKRYQDIYPLDFETDDWWALWLELLDVVRFWIRHGVRIFRVDNPHTKPFDFWEWLIAAVKAEDPETIFLAEAFTRPAVMYRLAKLGFSQSYTYFAWRNSKWELETYLADLGRVAAFFRPNFWPNTPDILTEALQHGGTPAFVTRLVLAATLAANYGVYGPAFELQEHVAREPGSEEYAGSEKYAVRHWDLDRPDSLAGLIARVNEVRHAHRALQRNDGLRFHQTDNDQLIAYSKCSGDDVVLVVANLDSRWTQSGWVDLGPLAAPRGEALEVRDLLTGSRFRWEGSHSFVILDPAAVPAHVLTVESSGGDA